MREFLIVLVVVVVLVLGPLVVKKIEHEKDCERTPRRYGTTTIRKFPRLIHSSSPSFLIARAHPGVDWTRSAAFALDRLNLRPLKAEQTGELLDDNKGPF